MTKIVMAMLVALTLGAMAPAAQAQPAYAAKDVNLRAGPGRDYPVVVVVPAGAALAVQGCLSDYAWCDVIAGAYRGWVYAGNIDYAYGDAYVPLVSYGPELGIAIVGFVLFDYWNRFYVNQPFYRDRDRWEHHAPPPRQRPPRHEPPVAPAPLLPRRPTAPVLPSGQRPPQVPPPIRQRPPQVPPPIRQPSPEPRQHPAPARPFAPGRTPAPAQQGAPMRQAPPAPHRDGARAPLPPGREDGAHGGRRPGPPERGDPSR